MELREVLKQIRGELGITQTEFAKELNVNYATVSRWELGKNYPNRSTIDIIYRYAENHHVTNQYLKELNYTAMEAVKRRMHLVEDSLFSIEQEELRNLIDDSPFAIYVCDLYTDDILYLNKKAVEMTESKEESYIGKKCYQCLMHRDTPCGFCHKEKLLTEKFSDFETFRPIDGKAFRVQGKQINWKGTKAQIRYIVSIGQSLSISVQKEKEEKYKEQLETRKKATHNCMAMAHFNLTQNTYSDVQSRLSKMTTVLYSRNIDEVLSQMRDGTLDQDERDKFDQLCNRQELIRMYFSGITHVSVKHHLAESTHYYESVIDLLQNPTTYDVEAISVLKDITEETLKENVMNKLLHMDYETIAIIDAVSGEPHPFTEGHIELIKREQKMVGDNVAGIESYLRKYCISKDVERVIKETSLSYVKEQLERRETFITHYSLQTNGKVQHKRTLYTYLDSSKTMILCAMQDISESYIQIEREIIEELSDNLIITT